MSRKNSGFAADLAAGIDLSEETAPRRPSIAGNVLTGRKNGKLHMCNSSGRSGL